MVPIKHCCCGGVRRDGRRSEAGRASRGRAARGRPSILCGAVGGGAGRPGRQPLVDEAVEREVGTGRAAVLAHRRKVVVQQAVQGP